MWRFSIPIEPFCQSALLTCIDGPVQVRKALCVNCGHKLPLKIRRQRTKLSSTPSDNASGEDLVTIKKRAQDLISRLAEGGDPALDVLLEDATTVRFCPQEFVFRSNAECDSFLIVLAGTFRVQLTSSGGRQATLYRIAPGESCMLTASCLLNRASYPAEAIAESAIEAIVITQESFHRALESSPEFRRYIFNVYSTNVTSIVAKIEQLTFFSIDARLSSALLSLHSNGEYKVTHQELAAELGTAREVVSRRLKHFEKVGWIRLARGRITVADRLGLQNHGVPALLG